MKDTEINKDLEIKENAMDRYIAGFSSGLISGMLSGGITGIMLGYLGEARKSALIGATLGMVFGNNLIEILGTIYSHFKKTVNESLKFGTIIGIYFEVKFKGLTFGSSTFLYYDHIFIDNSAESIKKKR
jgi:hypothetical protein